MIPSPYTEEAIGKLFRVGDSGRWKVNLEDDAASIAASAAARITSSSANITIKKRKGSAGKDIYCPDDIETDLIMRATYQRLLRQYKSALPNREEILSGIIEATSEASPYLVTRCDIRSFYESLDAPVYARKILVDTRTSPDLKIVLREICSQVNLAIVGAPRGLAISTVLAELALKDFDSQVRKMEGVHRYFRYADDILIFSIPGVLVLKKVEQRIRNLGMELNKKTVPVDIASLSSQDSPIPTASFSFLGYTFSVEQQVSLWKSRGFEISIASEKIQKRKTRIFLALHAFLRDSDAQLLVDRLTYLSTNRSVYKTKHSRGARRQKVRAGIRYNYSKCGSYPPSKGGRYRIEHSAAELMALDAVMKTALFGKNSEFSSEISKLPAQIQSDLAAISFAQGYRRQIMKRFNRQQVAKICKAWRHE